MKLFFNKNTKAVKGWKKYFLFFVDFLERKGICVWMKLVAEYNIQRLCRFLKLFSHLTCTFLQCHATLFPIFIPSNVSPDQTDYKLNVVAK